MAKTVNGAFETFLKDKVNLDKDETTKARSSRDWLIAQIGLFQNDETFPKSYSEKDIHYGSFARRTKIRPLDDIDLMICLSGQGGHYNEYSDKIEITVNPQSNLKALCNDYSDILNSKIVINKFLSKLSNIPQYSNAEIKRNLEAATLKLKSYDWVFDIVPCFFTAPDALGKTYYLIPDGKGNWKKTDPRIDKEKSANTNQKHSGYVLNVIRVIKYWNKRPTMPSMPSYLLETMILNYYDSKTDTASQFVDLEIGPVLAYIETYIQYQVSDPKGIQGNINNLSWDEITKISNRAKSDKLKANEARRFESNNDHEKSINKWREILGNEFPKYE
ncbi:MAG: nucleotidyltransferase [Ignavibacteria bacterium]|nr:nucleotidyltransferase [Ignavibacteria bacterium]